MKIILSLGLFNNCMIILFSYEMVHGTATLYHSL